MYKLFNALEIHDIKGIIMTVACISLSSHASATKGSSSHNSPVVVAGNEGRRRVKERPSSLSDGRASSSPAISTGRAAAVGRTASAMTVVSAVVYPQTPAGHSSANKVRVQCMYVHSVLDGQL